MLTHIHCIVQHAKLWNTYQKSFGFMSYQMGQRSSDYCTCIRVPTNVQQVLYIVCTCKCNNNIMMHACWCGLYQHVHVHNYVCEHGTSICLYMYDCVLTTMLWVNELEKKDYNSTLITSYTSIHTWHYSVQVRFARLRYMYVLITLAGMQSDGFILGLGLAVKDRFIFLFHGVICRYDYNSTSVTCQWELFGWRCKL